MVEDHLLASLSAGSELESSRKVSETAAKKWKCTKWRKQLRHLKDLTEVEKNMFAAQAPTSGKALGGTVTTPAWKTKPSWYHLGDERSRHPAEP
jgi:hypothetical protein